MAIHIHMSSLCHVNSYLTIWVNTNPTCLLNGGFLNPNTTYLLNLLVVLTHISNFIKEVFFSINLIDLNYEKPKLKFKKRRRDFLI